MRTFLFAGALSATLLAATLPGASGPKFVMSYFYDQDKSEFTISDFQFPSVQHGMAVGLIQDTKNGVPATITTVDGGAHWSVAKVKELSSKDVPLSLYFTNQDEGWMVTERGLWYTQNFGGSWRRLGDLPKGMLRVWFLTANHGWAIGANKQVIETTDGGKSWVPVAAAKEPPGAALNTTYSSSGMADAGLAQIRASGHDDLSGDGRRGKDVVVVFGFDVRSVDKAGGIALGHQSGIV